MPHPSLKVIPLFSVLAISIAAFAQDKHTPKILTTSLCTKIERFADSIRREDKMPELGFAVFTADSILCIDNIGVKNSVTKVAAGKNDWIHLGSNAKAILGFIAAQLVEQHEIEWNTKFFDLFPELLNAKNKGYANIELKDLLSHRAGIPAFTGENSDKGFHLDEVSEERRRYSFCSQISIKLAGKRDSSFVYSNAGYAFATLMLEKSTGKSWETLLADFSRQLNVRTFEGWPNEYDPQQPMGHKDGKPVNEHYPFPFKSSLYPAGNVSMPLRDYVRFLQINLKGLAGESSYLSPKTFEYLQRGVPTYAMGWAWKLGEGGIHYSTHNGSAGTYLCHVYLIHERHIGIVCWTNNVSKKSDKAVVTLRRLIERNL